jgi:hypothetical protein
LNQSLADTYVSSVQALWPGEPEPRLHRGRGSGRPLSGDEVELLVVPNARSPRLLLPAGNPVASSRAMLRFSAALTARDVAQRVGVSSALRARTSAAFPDRIVVSERQGSLRQHLSEVFGEPVDFSLGLGTARANRKPVLQVFDGRGRSLAFVKIGDTALTESLVRAEASSLERLAEAGLPPSLEVPELLHFGVWEGAVVLAMTSLETTPWQRPRRQFAVPHAEMRLLHQAFAEGDPRPLVELPLWDSMARAQESLSESPQRDRLGEALGALAGLAADRPLQGGAWHGDWTPWNMSRRRGRLQLWDWERLETGVPPGLDQCHYGVNAVCRRDGLGVESVRRGLELARVPSDPSTEGHLVAGAYLAAITCRYLQGSELDVGAAIAERSQVMLDALCGWLGLTASVSHG